MLPHLFPTTNTHVQNQSQFNGSYNWMPNSSTATDLLFDTTNSATNSFQNIFSATTHLKTKPNADAGSFFIQNTSNENNGFLESEISFTTPNNYVIDNSLMYVTAGETKTPSQNLQPQAITITLQYGSQKETIVVKRTQNAQVNLFF